MFLPSEYLEIKLNFLFRTKSLPYINNVRIGETFERSTNVIQITCLYFLRKLIRDPVYECCVCVVINSSISEYAIFYLDIEHNIRFAKYYV